MDAFFINLITNQFANCLFSSKGFYIPWQFFMHEPNFEPSNKHYEYTETEMICYFIRHFDEFRLPSMYNMGKNMIER